MPHPRKIYKKTELSNFTSCLNYTSRCNIVSDAEFTPESLKSDQHKIEEIDSPHKEYKEMPQESPSEPTKIDSSMNLFNIIIHMANSIKQSN